MDENRVNTLSVVTGLLVGVVFGFAGGLFLSSAALGIGLGVVMGLLAGVVFWATQREK